MSAEPVISFARGVPAPECLPVEAIAEAARAAVERGGAAVLNYGPVGGYPPLREWVAQRHAVEPANVFVTNGSLQGLSLLTAVLAGDGARVLVEAPTYDRALHIAARHRAQVVTIPQDDEGIDIDALEAALADGPAAFLYTIPTFQNPSGRTLSLQRRRRLAALAREGRVLVIEDDPYRLVRFEGEALPTLLELAEGAGVVHSFSFSKIAAPGLRVGYLVAPRELVARLEALAVQTYLAPSFLSQATALEFVLRGSLEPSLERVRTLLKLRRDAMLDALEQHLSDATWSRPQGGYFLWLDLPAGTDAAELLACAEQAGVTFVKGSDFFPGGADGRSSARLAYSFVSPAEISAGIARLAALPAQAPASAAAV
jgi:DNA-binding transcriptional MocR family regulator